MKAPTGSPITGTSDTILGVASGTFVDGAFNYDGNGTDVNWDSQQTKTIAGQSVYLDEDGNEWLESQLIAEDAEPAAETPPWHADPDLQQAELKAKFLEALRHCGIKVADHDRYLDDVVSAFLYA